MKLEKFLFVIFFLQKPCLCIAASSPVWLVHRARVFMLYVSVCLFVCFLLKILCVSPILKVVFFFGFFLLFFLQNNPAENQCPTFADCKEAFCTFQKNFIYVFLNDCHVAFGSLSYPQKYFFFCICLGRPCAFSSLIVKHMNLVFCVPLFFSSFFYHNFTFFFVRSHCAHGIWCQKKASHL